MAIVLTETTESDVQRAPCLREGPLAGSARGLVAAARRLGSSAWAGTLRAWCVPYLIHRQEEALAKGEEPARALNEAMDRMAAMLRAAGASGEPASQEVSSERPPETPVEQITGDHYGRLFETFSPASYWDEPVKLLRERLERNGIPVQSLEDKEVLDAGCGGGRYTVAWRLLGARACVGIDLSEVGLGNARRRLQESGIQDVTFDQGDVLDLPYADGRFDVVYSNGVLHHSRDWERGIREAVRVLKPGGLGFLYLIESPGGFYWDVVEILRVVTEHDDRSVARAALQLIGIPANRIFYMLDHVMVPINVRLTAGEVEGALRAAGATGIRRLRRGTDFDRSEAIHQGRPYAREHFGIGENRYIFTK